MAPVVPAQPPAASHAGVCEGVSVHVCKRDLKGDRLCAHKGDCCHGFILAPREYQV